MLNYPWEHEWTPDWDIGPPQRHEPFTLRAMECPGGDKERQGVDKIHEEYKSINIEINNKKLKIAYF